jgi:hypothetical protein
MGEGERERKHSLLLGHPLITFPWIEGIKRKNLLKKKKWERERENENIPCCLGIH